MMDMPLVIKTEHDGVSEAIVTVCENGTASVSFFEGPGCLEKHTFLVFSNEERKALRRALKLRDK